MKTPTPWTFAALLTLLSLTATACGELEPIGPDGPFVADVRAGDCEGDTDDFMVAAAGAGVTADVDGSTVHVHLNDVHANCCPSPGADVTVTDDLIEILFEDVTADDACGCTCVMDFDVDVEDVDPGSYTIEVYVDGGYFGAREIEVG